MPNTIKQQNIIVNRSLRLAFLGTPEFALPALEKLINSEYKPSAVFCAPDKPVGRKQVLTPPPVKVLAQKHNIPVYQPKNKTELNQMLLAASPSLVITAAYGLILSKEALAVPELGCLNIHPSLLPKYRGASPIQTAILNGDTITGITIYKMDEQMDTGPIIATSNWPIENSQITTPELSNILADLGAKLLLEILPQWIDGKIKPESQDDTLATYTKIIKKEDGKINWQKSAKEIKQQVRAYTPWPGSYSEWLMANDLSQKIKITKAEALEKNYTHQFGEVLLNNENLIIQTGAGSLVVKELQPEGGKPMGASDFLRGHKDIIGKILNT